MNLKTFTPDNTGLDRNKSSGPFISIRFDKGLFFFNQSACDLIGLKAGDKVIFLQDEGDKQNWYIEKSDQGFELKTARDTCKGLAMVRKVIGDAIGPGEGTARLKVAGKPTVIGERMLWGLLTNGVH